METRTVKSLYQTEPDGSGKQKQTLYQKQWSVTLPLLSIQEGKARVVAEQNNFKLQGVGMFPLMGGEKRVRGGEGSSDQTTGGLAW